MNNGKKRVVFTTLAILAIPVGLASRAFAESLPNFIAEHTGDVIWAACVYFGISILIPRTAIVARAALAIGFAFSVEASQLYRTDWLDSIRSSTLGGLVLGNQFVWADFFRYSVGVAFCGAIETMLLRTASQSKP